METTSILTRLLAAAKKLPGASSDQTCLYTCMASECSVPVFHCVGTPSNEQKLSGMNGTFNACSDLLRVGMGRPSASKGNLRVTTARAIAYDTSQGIRKVVSAWGLAPDTNEAVCLLVAVLSEDRTFADQYALTSHVEKKKLSFCHKNKSVMSLLEKYLNP